MTWAVRAWRASEGPGISIGTVMPVGWQNYVAEVMLDADGEADILLAEIAAARRRAREATGMLDEPMPGPYDTWPEHVAPASVTADEAMTGDVSIPALVRHAADMIAMIPPDSMGDDAAVSVCNALSDLIRRAAGLPEDQSHVVDDAIAWAAS